MSNDNSRSKFHAVNAAFFALILAGGAEAAQVQSALTANQVGKSVKQLMATTATTNIVLPTGAAKPAAMGNVVAGLHLGTNTDIFAVGTKSGFSINTSEFWVRYTLDPSSHEYHRYRIWMDESSSESTSPVSGPLWLSFNLTTQSLNMYTEKLSGDLLEYGDTGNFSIHPAQDTTSTLKFGTWGDPDYQILPGTNANLSPGACIECAFSWTLNLSFLQLSWNGSGYDLRTSAQGFDQIYTFSSEFSPHDNVDRYYANIAPVPVPGALWLFGSSLLGLATLRRRTA